MATQTPSIFAPWSAVSTAYTIYLSNAVSRGYSVTETTPLQRCNQMATDHFAVVRVSVGGDSPDPRYRVDVQYRVDVAVDKRGNVRGFMVHPYQVSASDGGWRGVQRSEHGVLASIANEIFA
jgi:hypothetical protein